MLSPIFEAIKRRIKQNSSFWQLWRRLISKYFTGFKRTLFSFRSNVFTPHIMCSPWAHMPNLKSKTWSIFPQQKGKVWYVAFSWDSLRISIFCLTNLYAPCKSYGLSYLGLKGKKKKGSTQQKLIKKFHIYILHLNAIVAIDRLL